MTLWLIWSLNWRTWCEWITQVLLGSKHVSSSGLFFIGSNVELLSQRYFADPWQEYKHIFPAPMNTAGCRLCPSGLALCTRSLLCLCVGVRKLGIELLFLPALPGSLPPHGGDWHTAFWAVFGPAAGCLQDHSWTQFWLLGHYVTQFQRIINGAFPPGYVLTHTCCVIIWLDLLYCK